MGGRKQKVAYFYDPEVGQFYYGQGHPMKPHRVQMAHSLVLHYGLYQQMQVYRPRKAETSDMERFHTADYIEFLRSVNPDNTSEYQRELNQFNMFEDCPVFDGLYKYCQITTGGSLGGAVKLNYGSADTVINWAGGLHHAKRGEASGFCYVNDIVLAALELLKYHQRVLYCDIDVHHGDGVEEAFLTTDRVMTVSFHKFGNNFFPGTGDIVNKGHGQGRYYALNIPLRDGITDDAYESIFKPVMARVMEVYRPEAVIMQCGSDSLAGDRLGPFNLSSRGHAACLEFMKTFNLPMLVLGGGGYKIINVARCWARETGVILGADMSEQLPANEYYEYYAPGYSLTVEPREGLDNANSKDYLDKLRQAAFEHLARIAPAPGVAFHARAPDAMDLDSLEEVNAANPSKPPAKLWDGELDPEEGGQQQGEGGSKRPRVDMSYRDAPMPAPGAQQAQAQQQQQQQAVEVKEEQQQEQQQEQT